MTGNLAELKAWISANFWKTEQLTGWVERHFVHRRHFPGGGVVDLGNYTLTVPATGTASLLGTAQTYSALKTFSAGLTFGDETLANYDTHTYSSSAVFLGSTSNPTLTYNTRQAYTTRIGNIIAYWIFLHVGTISGAGTGDLRVNLPFTASSDVTRYPGIYNWYDSSTATFRIGAFYVEAGQAYGSFTINGGVFHPTSALGDDDVVVMQGTYKV